MSFFHPKRLCRCGHAFEWHNACSRCPCAYFMPTEERNRALVKTWTAARRDREQREQL